MHEGVVRPLGVPTTNPVGRVSEKPTPVKELEFGLAKVKVNVLVLPVDIDAGEKLLVSVGTLGRGQPLI